MKVVLLDLLGKTLIDIRENSDVNGDEMVLYLSNGDVYTMSHSQDCCEYVRIEDIEGDLKDLIGSPLTQAEESTNREDKIGKEIHESFTWTFYKFATVKGYVTIRWLGESNGYYSEDVGLEMVIYSPEEDV